MTKLEAFHINLSEMVLTMWTQKSNINILRIGQSIVLIKRGVMHHVKNKNPQSRITKNEFS